MLASQIGEGTNPMADDQSRKVTCDLKLALFRYSGAHSWYDAEAGFKRQFVLSGRIDDPYVRPLGDIDESAGNSAFHDKPVRLTICTPADSERLTKVAARLGGRNSMGVALVSAQVEPDRFELDGEVVATDPVHVTIYIDHRAFEALRQQAAEAHDHKRIMWAKITLTANFLSNIGDIFHRTSLKQLDISEDTDYSVIGFEIFDTRYTNDFRDRILKLEPKHGEDYGTSLSILLTDAQYEISIERPLIHSICCNGLIINGNDKPYDGLNVDVRFVEHELNSYQERPERALFGEFSYYRRQLKQIYSTDHFTFYLRYLPEDAHNLLIPLLNQKIGTSIILVVDLVIKENELLATTEELLGDVRHYTFRVARRIFDYEPIFRQLNEARRYAEECAAGNNSTKISVERVTENDLKKIRRSVLAGRLLPDYQVRNLSLNQIDQLLEEIR
jgi:hypothetical protein